MDVGTEFDVKPCGLAARDSLRTGAGLPLSHQDIGPWPFIKNPWQFALPFNRNQTAFTKRFIGDKALLKFNTPVRTYGFVGYDLRKVSTHDPAVVLTAEGAQIGVVLTCATDMGIARYGNRIYSIGSLDKPEDFKPAGLCCGFVRVEAELNCGDQVILKDKRREIKAVIIEDMHPGSQRPLSDAKDDAAGETPYLKIVEGIAFMRYLPHTPEDIAAMLRTVNVDSLDDLFATVPRDCSRQADLRLPGPLTEWELDDYLNCLSQDMAVAPDYKVFIGAGSYEHYIPASVSHLLARSEFVTAYTPYQPEMAQGTLQGIYEYQTLTAKLLGMDVANASMYDGASSLAEALLMGLRIAKKKKKVAVSKAIHPHYRQVVETYFRPTEFEIVDLPYLENGRTDLSGLEGHEELAAVAVQSPNFFGVVEDLTAAAAAIHTVGTVFVASFTEPLAYGLLRNPGSCGADIVCGEGQSFGIPKSFGGPGLGMFSCLEKYVRSMPGRLVGQTTDLEGRRGYVLTLATREQHIRREKATSNICSNQGLCAMTAGIYMATLGGTGIRRLSRLNYDKAEYFKAELEKAGAKIRFSAPTFNEFVVEFTKRFKPVAKRLLKKKIIAGLELGVYYPELENNYLFCVTETVSKEVMDTVVREVKR